MITIFCDFCQFSANKMAFFSKTDVMINFCKNGSRLSKNASIFAKFLGENNFKIKTSTPGPQFGPLGEKMTPTGEVVP
jgi:hypothetical protein